MRRASSVLVGLVLGPRGGTPGGLHRLPRRATVDEPLLPHGDSPYGAGLAVAAGLQRGVRRQPRHRRGDGRPRRGRGRSPGVLQPAAGDRCRGRVPVLRRRPADPVEVPDPRAVGRGRPLLLHRGPPGRGRRAGQHSPRLRPGRAEPAGARRTGRRRAGHRGRGPTLVDPEASPLGDPTARRRLAGAVHRRPQRAVTPRLDGGDHVPARRSRAGAWPVSEALVGAGLRDSYREAHPDPVADPGNTWGGVAGSKAAAPGGSTTRTSAARSTSRAARSSANEAARASIAGTRGGPPTTAPCSRS